ncbi:adenine deaminase [Paenibacillus filicis]|uniref:Adenine deaminase n=1 Tax=Paenibacillus gyeongsangnamensis TaxID=3388067 RepID=A0ABT4QC98_9BACL|nr:adenine deaminase [Paenibacillus filicis]MCZ8514518.1 adenine deaminase [Paenibacillus filicis]
MVRYRNERVPLHEVMPKLVATARGDLKASLVVLNARLVNVCSGEIMEGMSVGVQGARIAYVGRQAHKLIGPDTRVVDAGGKYLAPGFLDGHCHIESTQLTVTEFARAVLPLGTTGGFFDAHEIANVMGLRGLRLMLEEAQRTPLAAYMQVASCVPSTDASLETSGAVLGPSEVEEAFGWGPDVIALGEVMNFPGVVYGDERMLGEVQAALRAGRAADGHFTWASDDERLIAYAASGITGDHECVTKEDVAERVRLGMYAMMRRGSAWHDVEETIKAHTELGLDPRRMMLVTDDRSVESLVDEGHMNFVIRNAIRQGVKPVTAIQMATINTAERFGVVRDVGTVTPGSYADLVLLEGHLADVNVAMTICGGQVVAEDGRMAVELEKAAYPEDAIHSVNLARMPEPKDFAIAAPVQEGRVTVRVIRVQENHVETKASTAQVEIRSGRVELPPQGLCKIAVFERHHRTGQHSVALVEGIGFYRTAALAMTVAHDSHNLLVIGNDDERMAQAAAKVASIQGGAALVTEDGEAVLPLPIAGLLSDRPYEEVAEHSRQLSRALQEAGCRLNYALMTLSLLALVVIPELRLSDKGLVEITPEGIRKVGLFVE